MDEEEITMDTTFVDDLGADSLDIFRLLWESKKNSTSRSRMRMLSIS